MTTEQYMQECPRTESNDFHYKGNERLLHAGIGMVTEAGEFIDALKKAIFYGSELDRVNLREELGDMTWYLSMAISELGTTYEEVMDINIAKLKARYPEKFTLDKASNRDLSAEREILERK